MRATEDHLKQATTIAGEDCEKFEQWPWCVDAERAIMHTEEWRKFRQYRAEIEAEGRKFLEEGVCDLWSHEPYLALYRRFEKYVIQPLEEKWQALLLRQEDLERRWREAEIL